VPAWLARELGGDPWLIDLAMQMLVWVGTTASAGYDLWPTQSWVVRRCERLGGWTVYGEAGVRTDIDTVLRAMRRRPGWYERYVEAPLGRKQAPVVSIEDDILMTVPAGHESALTGLAEAAVRIIEARLARREPARAVVADVLTTVFGADPGTSEDFAGRAYDDRLARLLTDGPEMDRLVAAVLEIVGGAGHV
jgi:hypothetical protein